MNIRKEYFYPSPYDERYWKGGIHELLDEAWMKRVQKEDLNSYFALAFDSNEKVKAYVRFSTNIETTEKIYSNNLISFSSINLAKIHIIAASKDIRGKEQVWQINQENQRGRVGQILYKEVFSFCKQQNCNAVVADVCVHPVPNVPSLTLHKNFSFIPLAQALYKYIRTDESGNSHAVSFVQLVKALKGWKLQRLSDQRLLLSPS